MPDVHPANPFPGLRPYQDYEASLFFGRKSPAAQIIEKLGSQRFIAVVGTSGSGKSSIVNCGVLPTLFAGFYLPRGSRWRVVRTEPGGEPIARLAERVTAALADRLGGDADDGDGAGGQSLSHIEALSEAILRHGEDGLVNLVRQARLPRSDNVLIVVDQFEELFRYRDQHPGPDEARDFVDLLLRAAEDQGEHIYVMLTMRSDFLGDCMLLPGLPEAINDGLFLVPAMNRGERERAVRGPVKVAGAEIEAPLVDRILDDIGDELDQLPLLQHALMRTWQKWQSDAPETDEISLRHYLATVSGGAGGGNGRGAATNGDRAAGGHVVDRETATVIERALDDHAEAVWRSLNSEQQVIARKIFRAITEVDEQGRRGRKPRRLGPPAGGESDGDRQDLAYVTSVPVEQLIPVIEAFRATDRSFLKPEPRQELGSGTVVGEDLHAGSVIDVWHESLIRNWSTLHGWMDDEARDAEIYKGLAKEAAAESPSLTRAKLQTAIEWAEGRLADAVPGGRTAGPWAPLRRRALGLSGSEVAAISPWVSKYAADTPRVASFAQVVSFFRKKVRQWAGIRYGVRVATVAAVVGLLIVLAWQRNRTHDEQRAAYAQLAGSLSDPLHGALVISELREEPPKDLLLLDLFESAKPPGIDRIGRVVETSGVPVAALLNDSILGAVSILGFDASGDSVVIASTPGSTEQILLWPRAGGTPRALYSNHAAVFPARLAVTDSGPIVGLFSDGRVGTWVPGDSGFSFAATLSDSARDSIGAVNAMGIASDVGRDGRRVAVVYHSKNSRWLGIWSVDGSERSDLVFPVTPADESTDLVVLSDDATTVATVAGVRATVWNGATGEKHLCAGDTSDVHEEDIERASFDTGGRRLATASRDGSVRVWAIDRSGDGITCTPERVLQPHLGAVNHAKFSPDGRHIVTVADDRLVRLWSLDDPGGEPTVLSGHTSPVTNAWFSPDSKSVATVGADGDVIVWSVANPRRIQSLFAGTDTAKVAFDATGQFIATAAANGGVRVWTAMPRTINAPLRLEGHERPIAALALSSSDTIALTGSVDGTVIAWDLIREQPIGVARSLATTESEGGSPDSVAAITSVAIGPRDEYIAAAAGTEIRLMPLASQTRESESPAEASQSRPVSAMAFLSDGRLVTGADDGVVRIWSADSELPVDSILSPNPGQRGWTVTALAADPTSPRVLVSYRRSKTAILMMVDGASTASLWSSPEQPTGIRAAAYSPTGRRFATARDKDVSVWTAAASEPQIQLEFVGGGLIRGIVFGPNGERLLAYGDSAIVVWDLRTRAELDRVVPESLPDSAFVTGAALGRDGNLRVWTASSQSDAVVWPVPWSEMVDGLRASTTACLTANQRIAFFDETPTEAVTRAIERCPSTRTTTDDQRADQ